MAPQAFVLMETETGKHEDVLTRLRKIEGVRSAHFVTGPYDVIAIVEMVHINELGSLIGGRIHPIPGIKRTVTCIVMDDVSIFDSSL